MAPQPIRRPAGATPLRVALVYTAALRGIYAVYAAIALRHLTIDPRLVHSNAFTDHLMPPGRNLAYALWGVWERFDTLWYLHIAQHGYDRPASIVFYPLYPFLIRVVSALVHPPLVAALGISTAATFAFAWGLQELIELDSPRATALRAIVLLAAWPAGFMLFAAYADSLVMALTVWSVYHARQERWWLAGLLGLLGGSAKAVGCLAAVPIAWLAWKKAPRHLWAAVLPFAMPAAFNLWIRQSGLGSATAAYAAYWHTRVAFPWTTLWESIRAFFGPSPLLIRLNLLLLTLAAGLALFRRLRPEYRLYALAMLAMFLTKSTTPLLQSTMRYVLAIFPAFIGLSMLLEKRATGMVVLCALFLLANGVLLYGFFRWSLLV